MQPNISKVLSFVITVAIFLGAFFEIALATVPTTITGIRSSNTPDSTRFVFDVSNSVDYKLLSPAQTSSVVLALNNTHLPNIKLNIINTKVQHYQINPQPKQSLQLILDLKTKADIKAYTLMPSGPYGHRLVLDIKNIKSTTTSFSKPKNREPVVIIIDPGHGGKDPGAIGAAGQKEKNVVLAISKILKQLLNQAGYRAELTRSQDVYIPLRQRLAIARRHKADLFVAVHADAAYKNADANGASVFALSERGATSEMARWLAQKENESELVEGVFVEKDRLLRSVLLDLSQTHTISVSLEMGHAILRELSGITKLHYPRVEQAAFVVLKSPDIPSLLIETGYLSNPKQARKLLDPIYQRQIAASIVAGIKSYFARHPDHLI